MCFRPPSVELDKKCPSCGATAAPGISVCSSCGEKLPAGSGAPGVPGAPGAPGAPKAPGAPGAPKAPGSM